MAASPKDGDSLMANKKAATKSLPPKRATSLRFALLVVLITAICGALVAVSVFYSTSGHEEDAKASASARSVPQEKPAALELAEVKCEEQKCKIGGDPICGTNGKTYLNDCYFQNAQCRNASIDKVENWKGYNCPNTCKKNIACKEIGKYLCASDGNVYFGYCNLYIAQCLDESITEVPCDKSIFEGAF
ncbi:hypothetical protein Poli38472_010329 [Pythium oligandrum]|uniref:Kazal-like domain-containing protein n=1 Tax=Pythium oligandrum TaxID=41045 RepID=A0A8K1C2W4_PYTOL|nr:hypothetical protein Poli38472_010329 [Pythium oligandrum]|eukprot:TMW55447.1 hypothetical protein Poli38472_010329 [Pythium oligandrum]